LFRTFLSYYEFLFNLKFNKFLYVVELVIKGIGYKFEKKSPSILQIKVGYSHLVYYIFPYTVSFVIVKNYLALFSFYSPFLGSIGSEIRGFRVPNIYSGKGIRYINEVVKQKEGKKRQR